MGIWPWKLGLIFLLSLSIGLIPARVRSEWARLQRKVLASVWAPACQECSHVGNAGVGVISMRGAPIAFLPLPLPSLRCFFDCGRAVRCMLPLGGGRFMHLVVLYGCQGADTDAEQLALTEQLFDAALGELGSGCTKAALFDCWGFQRGAHRNPLPVKRDFGWAVG